MKVPVGMGERAVDKKMPEDNEDNHGVILHAVSKAATDEGCSNDRKGQLKRAKKGLRNSWGESVNSVFHHSSQP